jgi:hypothetical protein
MPKSERRLSESSKYEFNDLIISFLKDRLSQERYRYRIVPLTFKREIWKI